MKKITIKILSAVFLLAPICTWASKDAVIENGTPIVGSDGSLINLNQGWTQAEQSGFWYRGDGSKIVRYDWFLHLEQADNEKLFRADENIERLRYTPIPKSEWNPDGMPAGFSKNYDRLSEENWMALSCGGCHSTKLNYNGTSMVINGAATMGDFQTMMLELEQAMTATYNDKKKFDRFAKAVLGNEYSRRAKRKLRRAFKKDGVDRQVNFNHTNRTPVKWGYGRVDAFAYAYNNIGVNFLGIPENHVDGVAPANYNYVWGSAQSDVLQWNGMAPNTPPIAPIFRVLGDVWGGGGFAEMKGGILPGYQSSADFKGLGDMLAWVKVLQSPKWPENILPRIDAIKAARGRQHYDVNCKQCHQLTLTRDEQMKPYKAVMVPQSEVGTDRAELDLIQDPVQKTGFLEGTKMYYFAGEKLGPTTPAKNLLNIASIGAMIRHPLETIGQGMRDFTGTLGSLTKDVYQYKARPLNGIWATAPYLHNGSVANMYQLLLPAAERDKIFYTGDREFDPLNVGQHSDQKEGLYRFDTSVYGNSNAGHEYGTQLSENERYELIEFLKTL